MMKKTEMGRLALRKEGEFWNAYWAPNVDNMDNSILIGCIRLSVVKGRVYEDFIELMQTSFEAIVKDALKEKPIWIKTRVAPENERGGNA